VRVQKGAASRRMESHPNRLFESESWHLFKYGGAESRAAAPAERCAVAVERGDVVRQSGSASGWPKHLAKS